MIHDTNGISPYVGPRSFERTKLDQDRFFGRENDKREIESLIYSHQVLLVYAQSGAGKTSVFNAKIAPSLESNGFDVLPLTRVSGIPPQGIDENSISNLYVFNILLNLIPETDPKDINELSLTAFLGQIPRATGLLGQPAPRVIAIDQFEELFSLYPKNWQSQQDDLFKQISDALGEDPLLRIVIIIREEYLARIETFSSLLPEGLRIRYRIERLKNDEALLAITKPLVRTKVSYGPGVAEQLVNELLKIRIIDNNRNSVDVVGQYVEPVQLQIVCLKLWERLPAGTETIKISDLESFGDVDDSLAYFYGEAIQSIVSETDIEEYSVRQWIEKYLITPMHTRGTVVQGEMPKDVTDILESKHVIRVEYRAGAWWYELTHDRFIQPILLSNAHWNEQHRKGISLFSEQAKKWNDLGGDEDSLLRGRQLEEVIKSIKNHGIELNAVENKFLETSIALQDEKKRQRNQRLIFILIAVFVTFVAITFVSFSLIDRDRDRAKSSAGTALAAESTSEIAKAVALTAESKAIIGATAVSQKLAVASTSVAKNLVFIEELQQSVQEKESLEVQIRALQTLIAVPPELSQTVVVTSSQGTITPVPTVTSTPNATATQLAIEKSSAQATQEALRLLYALIEGFDTKIYSEPSYDADVVDTISVPAKLRVIATNNSFWVQLETNEGEAGWLDGRWIIYEGDSSLLPAELRYRVITDRADLPFVRGIVFSPDDTQNAYSLRNGPTLENKVLLDIPVGTDLVVLRSLRGDTVFGSDRWYIVTLPDPFGYYTRWTGYLPAVSVKELEGNQ